MKQLFYLCFIFLIISCSQQIRFKKGKTILDVEYGLNYKLLLDSNFEYLKEDVILLGKKYGDTLVYYGFRDTLDSSEPIVRYITFPTELRIEEISDYFLLRGGKVSRIEKISANYYGFHVTDTIESKVFSCDLTDRVLVIMHYYESFVVDKGIQTQKPTD